MIPPKFLRWTCSSYVHHEHRFRWLAWLCGVRQRLRLLRLEWKYRHIDPDVCCCGREISKVRYFDSICAHGGCRSQKEYMITEAMKK